MEISSQEPRKCETAPKALGFVGGLGLTKLVGAGEPNCYFPP